MGIIVYTKPVCAACLQTKNYLKAHGADFEEKDITESEANMEKMLETGLRSMPVVVANGQTWSGYDESKLKSVI